MMVPQSMKVKVKVKEKSESERQTVEAVCFYALVCCKVAEVVRRHKGPSPKNLDLDENFKPYYTLF